MAGTCPPATSASAGDALFVPQGAPIGWESSERVAKFYVVQDVRPEPAVESSDADGEAEKRPEPAAPSLVVTKREPVSW